jgi:uncharacterized protein YyaL (SSP411 family)
MEPTENTTAHLAKHTNRLAREKSPYLLQHAHNPVEWYPWAEDAFEKARGENKPIFLSIGYSTCHWCHVMAHESFEDESTAEILNREFVNVKVDREERPDVDRVYMTFVQATTGHGGWPMSVWLTPDLKPFVGGTYFPPDDRYGQPGFKKVVERVAAAWKQDPQKISESGSRIIAALSESQTHSHGHEHELPGANSIAAAYKQIARSFDPQQGGYGGAPKFPRPVTLNFMFRVYAREGADSEIGAAALEMNLFTLRKMAAGGIRDHLGGGFHRYSVDPYWHIPHFEKMLYDQAQLAVSYADAFQITRDPLFESVLRDTLDYVRRDMTHGDGGFFSAEDADSVIEHGKPDHAEGAFYVWSEKEIDIVLGAEAELFKSHYGVQPHGNAPAGSDPHDEFRGKNILIERRTVAETAERFGKAEADVSASLRRSRETLFRLRDKRPRPQLDDKIITAGNGLMISAFARGAQVLGAGDYAAAATRAAEFLQRELYDPERNELARNYREGRSAVAGFADDYAFLIQGLLDLYEATFETRWLKFATALQEAQDRLFWDEGGGGYFGGTGKDRTVLLRMKDDHDGAEPAASSGSALNLLRLAQIHGRGEWRDRAEKTIAAFAAQLAHVPSSMPQMLVALDFSLSSPRQIVVAGKPDAADTRALIDEVQRHFVPNKVLLLADGGDSQTYLAETSEALAAMSPIGGRATAYVCENFACQAPVTTPQELADLIAPDGGRIASS